MDETTFKTGRHPDGTPLIHDSATPTGRILAEFAAERRRQIEVKGWTPEHDDEHDCGELALAAALYAIPYDSPLVEQDDFIGLDMALTIGAGWELKPEPDARKRLIKAGAMILAEIERLDRAKAKEAGG